jgi:nicotinate-nucleotide pyrophosphorylase (carboxylating)
MLIKLLKLLEEDVGYGDVTTDSVIPKDAQVRAEIIAKESGVIAGLEECITLLKHFGLEYKSDFEDGDEIEKGTVIIEINGNARAILSLERVLLNILMRMSGIASVTRKMVKKCESYGVMPAGTRKTTPGFRSFEKKAIAVGGGDPHRFRLDDAVLIKNNHIAIAGLEKAIEETKKAGFTKKIEVEVSSIEDAIKASKLGVDIIMLDNMKLEEIERAIPELRQKKVIIELSGGITPENIEEYAKSKPDIISLGYLTTQSPWLDMNMRIK